MPDELEREVEDRLAYGDSKAGWMRSAIKLRLQVDPLLDERFGNHEPEERWDFIEEAVQEKLEREEE